MRLPKLSSGEFYGSFPGQELLLSKIAEIVLLSKKDDRMMHFFLCVVNSTTQIVKIAPFSRDNVDEKSLNILLYGNRRFDAKANRNISMCSLKFIKDLHTFDNSL